MLLSANGIVATTETLTSKFFQLIYVVPLGNYDKRWALYGPDLREYAPSGYASTDVSRPYYRDSNWEHERRVANDSYPCPNPDCCLYHPKGFAACVTCGCRFTFGVVTGHCKVALPSADDNVGDEEITTEEFEAYGIRVAKCVLRAKQNKIHVFTDEGLLWHQVLRCLDWRRKWDYVCVVTRR